MRYASWDLGHVHLVDERTGVVLARLYPQDKTQNASGLRRSLDPISTASNKSEPSIGPAPAIPPLLARMLDKQAAAGLASPYLPKDDAPPNDRASDDQGNTDDGETM